MRGKHSRGYCDQHEEGSIPAHAG